MQDKQSLWTCTSNLSTSTEKSDFSNGPSAMSTSPQRSRNALRHYIRCTSGSIVGHCPPDVWSTDEGHQRLCTIICAGGSCIWYDAWRHETSPTSPQFRPEHLPQLCGPLTTIVNNDCFHQCAVALLASSNVGELRLNRIEIATSNHFVHNVSVAIHGDEEAVEYGYPLPINLSRTHIWKYLESMVTCYSTTGSVSHDMIMYAVNWCVS